MARTILVVEDETTLRETLADALEAEGFRVVQAADGREALARFRGDRPDLVLLDLMLPELSGIEVCRIIRAESGVPIVMLTAKDSELDKVVGLELGADDYVTKPFSLRELSARIRALFRRSEQGVAVETPPAGRRPRAGPGRPRRPSRAARRRGDADQAEGVRPARVPHPPSRPGRSPATSSSSASGATTTRARRGRSTSTSTGCAAEVEEDAGAPQFIHTVRGVGYVFRRPAGLTDRRVDRAS